MNIQLSHWLEDNLDNFDEAIQRAVFAFASHVEQHGLKGRNKSSVLPNPHTQKEQAHTKFAF